MPLQSTVEVTPPPPNPVRALARWAATSCPNGGRVLEVGAGEHSSGALKPLLRRRPAIVGVDPDDAIDRNPDLVEAHHTTVEEFATTHSGEFDLVLSIFVLEHVERPEAFAAACATVLRPGGVWFALTLNRRHYFGATAWATNRVGVERRLLRLLKGEAAEHDHRFPTHYRLNSRRAIERACDRAGFSQIDFRVYDAPDRYAWYLPAPIDRFPRLYTSAVYRAGWPSLMGHLSFRAQKA